MGQIKPFYGTGYATGTYENLYSTYLTAYWLASGNALANVTCTGPNEVLLDLSIPNPIHFYNFNNDLSDSFGSTSGMASPTSSFIWGKHNYAASGEGSWIISNMPTTRLPVTFTFWTYFSNEYINSSRIIFANIDQDGFGSDENSIGLYRINANTNNRMELQVFGATSSTSVELTGVPIISGDWQFHVVGIDATNQTGYYSTNGSGIVGTSLSALGESMNSNVGQSGGIFGDYNGANAMGLIDSIGVFNTSMLTLNQIKALWFGGSGKYYSGGWRQ